jgi:hypothetical protein
LSRVPHFISLSDLLMIEDFKKAAIEGNEERVKQHLHHNGMDTNLPYNLNFVTHRNLRNQIVSCERYEGVERRDKAWMNSRACSTENIIASSDFAKSELMQMSKEGFSGKWDEQVDAILGANGLDREAVRQNPSKAEKMNG